ncbi:MAG TPA: hypothetical protein VJ347_15835 [Streptosporangiaceae bacterium]|nr:hypothetical protein [Streptosporangiaceae bacterium]HJY73248.1 hypothetical protein [Streptosporangiaceae bacterium]
MSPAGGGDYAQEYADPVLWLIIGAAAAGQRGYFGASPFGCTQGATVAVTIAAGPLNYIGLNPRIGCTTPKPSS